MSQPSKKLRASALFLACIMAILTPGCGSSSSNADRMLSDMNNSNIKRLANAYAMYQFRNEMRGPKDEAALVAYLQDQDEGRLKRVGIDKSKLNDLFVGERDKQKFQVRWGVNTKVHAPADPVVFEAEGLKGVRLVAFAGGEVVEADDELYEKLWNGENLSDTRSQGRADGQQPGGGQRR